MLYSDFKVAHEMDFITQDMKYITAYLHILRPYINNPLEDEGTYRQTVGDRRYLMHVTFGLQAVYNFWDRIGDLLWHYFPTPLKERDVYFERVIDLIPAPYNTSTAFTTLKTLYDSHVKNVLKDRKEAVHYFQPECRHYWGHVENSKDKVKVKEMFDEKYGYADMMKAQLAFAVEGFELALNLINELPAKSHISIPAVPDTI